MSYDLVIDPTLRLSDYEWDCPKCGSDSLTLPKMPQDDLQRPPWGERAKCNACGYQEQLEAFWRTLASQVGDHHVPAKDRAQWIDREYAFGPKPTTPEEYIEGIRLLISFWITMHTRASAWMLWFEDDDDPREAAMNRFKQEPIIENKDWGWYFDWKESALQAYAENSSDDWVRCLWCGSIEHHYDIAYHEDDCQVKKAWEQYEEDQEEFEKAYAEWSAGDKDSADEPEPPDEPEDSRYCTCTEECSCAEVEANDLVDLLDELQVWEGGEDSTLYNVVVQYVLEAALGAGFDAYYECMASVWDGHLQAMLDGLRQVDYAIEPAEQLAAAQMLANLNHVGGALTTYAADVGLDGDYLDAIQQDGFAAHLDSEALQEFFEEGVVV